MERGIIKKGPESDIIENEWKSYRRVGFINCTPWHENFNMMNVSISQEDKKAGSPKLGDMIASNPANPSDQWLIAEEYFKNNYTLE